MVDGYEVTHKGHQNWYKTCLKNILRIFDDYHAYVMSKLTSLCCIIYFIENIYPGGAVGNILVLYLPKGSNAV